MAFTSPCCCCLAYTPPPPGAHMSSGGDSSGGGRLAGVVRLKRVITVVRRQKRRHLYEDICLACAGLWISCAWHSQPDSQESMSVDTSGKYPFTCLLVYFLKK